MSCSFVRGRFRSVLLGLLLPWGAAGPGRAAAEATELPALNDPPTAARLSGKFIWADLFTADPALAAVFYTGLFGWEPTRLSHDGHTYIVLSHQGVPTAGIVARPGARGGPVPGRWIGYVAVGDMERAVAAVRSAGGAVLAPVREFPRRGSQAIVADAEGAVFGLMRSASGDPGDYESAVGDWIWSELFSRLPERAADFYHAALGYETRVDPLGPGVRQFLLESGGYARAAITPLPEVASPASTWLRWVRVADVDRSAARAMALGGRVLLAPRLSHLGTRHAIVADPRGAAIGIIEFMASAGGERAAP